MTTKRSFGRRVEFDERSRAFPIRAIVAPEEPRSYTWKCGVVLDQGSTSACTGFSMAHELAARPCVVKDVTNALGQTLYKRARQLDQWPGEDYDGSSVLGAVKAVKEKGYITEYRWSFSVDELAIAVSRHGPAVLGISWYSGMSTPDAAGYIWPTGGLAGGHAILCNGFSVKLQAFRLHNSWGPGWGKNGECLIDKLTLGRLLKEDGEACVPVVRRK